MLWLAGDKDFSSLKDGKCDSKKGITYKYKLIILSICDTQGRKIFTDADIDKLGALPSPVIDDLSTELSKLNGLSDDSTEEIAGN